MSAGQREVETSVEEETGRSPLGRALELSGLEQDRSVKQVLERAAKRAAREVSRPGGALSVLLEGGPRVQERERLLRRRRHLAEEVYVDLLRAVRSSRGTLRMLAGSGTEASSTELGPLRVSVERRMLVSGVEPGERGGALTRDLLAALKGALDEEGRDDQVSGPRPGPPGDGRGCGRGGGRRASG